MYTQTHREGDGLPVLLLRRTLPHLRSPADREGASCCPVRMRSQLDWTGLVLSLLLLISVRGDAQGQGTECSVGIRVRRNTNFKQVATKSLKITCPVQNCGQTIDVTWCKIQGNNCIPLNKTNGITVGWEKPEKEMPEWFLAFASIKEEDSGKYRCRLSGDEMAVGHNIDIAVTGNEGTTQDLSWLPYIYICTGMVVVVVIMVMAISFLLIYGCKRSERPRKSDLTHCQYKETKISNGFSHPHLTATRSPYNGHGGAPPIRTKIANQTTVEMDSSSIHDDDSYRSDRTIIYAALNHRAPQQGPVRTSVAMEEFSEYAAIRVC
ncbi:hypothetical protein AGOR_G00218990 [Albula goreensis]|uniref:Ig-like domain-containing protein n=1 Tax=Albula goreensis TaxID=1534307 RepID=A0A8T3CLL8_9TELE|nr:hypothetical protein AGOR_G00218990 [Albula goreensis]